MSSSSTSSPPSSKIIDRILHVVEKVILGKDVEREELGRFGAYEVDDVAVALRELPRRATMAGRENTRLAVRSVFDRKEIYAVMDNGECLTCLVLKRNENARCFVASSPPP